MSFAVVKVAVYHLDHPTRKRRFTFTVNELGIVNVRRWNNGRLVSQYELSKEQARKRYGFLTRVHGYQSW